MGNGGPSQAKSHWTLEEAAWIVPLLIYAGLTIFASIHNADVLTPDAVAYIRRAVYLSRGELSASVSGYWSPLLSWTIAPLLWTGLEPLVATRIALVLWGGVLVAAVHAFIRVFTAWNWRWRLLLTAVVALIAAVRAVRQITPDVALAACLFAYFAALLSPAFAHKRQRQVLTGLLGGLAFLAKAYALPFVALHLLATLALRAYASRSSAARHPSNLPSALGFTLAGWLLIAGPWIGILSLKYERLTFSTVGRVARAVVGPVPVSSESAFEHRRRLFAPPPDPYVAHIENQDALEQPGWSPFSSLAHLRFQLRLLARHTALLAGYFDAFAWLKLALIALAVSLLAMIGVIQIETFPPWKAAWLLGTTALFCGGFLFVYVEARYVDILAPTLLLIALLAVAEGFARLRASRGWSTATVSVAVVICGAFALPAMSAYMDLYRPHTFALYRDVARLIKTHQLNGPIACTNRYAGMFLALHTGQKQQQVVALTPNHVGYLELEQTLLAGRPACIVIWSQRRDSHVEANAAIYARELVARLGWVRQFRVKRSTRLTVEVFAPVPGDPDPYTPAPFSVATQPAAASTKEAE